MSIGGYTSIAIVNRSAFADTQGATIVTALNKFLPEFCADWNIPKVTAHYVSKSAVTDPSVPLRVYLLDDPRMDVIDYHDMPYIPRGRVFIGTIESSTPVSSVICHEVMELLIDPTANVWWMGPDRATMYAAEVVDPVQGNTITVSNVCMSDYILPAWADSQRTKGPFNKKNTLSGPFKLAKGGYAIVVKSGSAQEHIGDGTPAQGDNDLRTQLRKGTGNPSVPPTPTTSAFVSPGATATISENSIRVAVPPVTTQPTQPSVAPPATKKLTNAQRAQLARKH